MKINALGLALIKEFEGLELKAYLCPAGVLTIGYGSTENVTPGLCISEEDAEKRLREHLDALAPQVEKLLKKPVTDNQFSAIMCFAYNCGIGNLARSRLIRCINTGDLASVPQEFVKWTKANGKELPGLVKRRQAEADLFKTA